ncbi:endosomal cargo receptor [Colletotrichum karsti]|uniref:Endosomal cargo receptor n=1 Tax=Colletotrichum karsti TaxID=1095194 RepID=A0A9P6LPZ6_9PEZI|nr:endosomal cargo receptor [Colletotrichum karsti]KAF9881026.1 endosomal cargo receptor [Colletotrichum karsti]
MGIFKPNPTRERVPKQQQNTTFLEVAHDLVNAERFPPTILQERQRGGRIEYLIDWDDDEDTGEQYPPSWSKHPSEDVTAKAIFDWKKKQGEFATSDEDSGSEIAPSQAPAADTLDSSQPIQPPHRRKRQRGNSSVAYSDSEIEDSDEDAPNPPKRHRSEPLSLSSSSEVDTDAASDILLESPSNIFVAIASKVDFDATEYLSVSNSQGSTSFGSQPVSALEDEDNQVILTENLSQRIIPDSQDYSAFESQDSHIVASTDLQITHQGAISSGQATHSQQNKSEGSSSETNQEAAPTAIVATQHEDFVTIRDSQNDSNNTQHAQRVLPLPHISASQIDTNSLTEEDIVPDTEESFRTCVERRSLPPTHTEPTAIAQATRLSSLPPNMASTDGEPMSAIEELMRLSQSIMEDDGDEEPYSGSGENQQQVGGDSGPGTETIDSHDFSMPMENPLMEIHSQLPISTDWNMEGDSTSSELPVQSSAPLEPVIEAPVSQPPQTANMGDIFPGGLMPPEPVQELPMTISPSDISRSMEPDDGLNTLHQQGLPLNILPAEDTATAKSTASSPDVEEQYPSGPPTAMDQSEYLVTVSFPANIRSLYLNTMSEYKKEIEKFTLMCRNGEELPDQSLVDSIGRLLDQLRDICDLPASLDGASIDALSAEDLRKHAMGTNSKYFFVGRFLERLQTSNKKVLIIVRDINIMGYLEAVIGTNDMAYSLKGLHELESQDEHSLHVLLMHTEQTLVDDLSDFDVVIGFDCGILRTDVVTQWAQMNGRKPMLIRLMTTYSIEHLELYLPDDKEDLERKNALLISLYQSRALINRDDQAEMIDGLTSHFANQVIDPEPKFGWEPEPIPNSVLDLYSESQTDSQMPPTAEELKSRKRKADDDHQEVTKRLRVSPPPGQAGGSVDDAVRGHLNPKPAHVHVQTTQDHLDSLNNKISELEHQLGEKTTLEHNLRKHITNISKRVKSHDKTTNHIHERLMEAIEDRSRFEAQQKEAKQSEEKALKKCQTWQNKVQKLEEELEKKSATLERALVDAGTVATDVFKQKTDELEQSHAKIAELEKKLESRDNELSYARDVYQTANQANSELERENKILKEQVAEFHKQAAGSLAQIQNTNANEQIMAMRRQVEENQAITRDREKELTRVEKELRTLKNGRRETRQQSVPRSPRLGMMSPRAPRAAGGSASRGTSPVPYDSSGSTPVPGMQFLPSNNHRFNHLRE